MEIREDFIVNTVFADIIPIYGVSTVINLNFFILPIVIMLFVDDLSIKAIYREQIIKLTKNPYYSTI